MLFSAAPNVVAVLTVGFVCVFLGVLPASSAAIALIDFSAIAAVVAAAAFHFVTASLVGVAVAASFFVAYLLLLQFLF